MRILYSSLVIITHHYRTKQRNNTTGAVYGTGNAYPSGAPDFTPGFSGVRVVSYFLFITVDVNVHWFCESLFTPWFLLLLSCIQTEWL